MKTCTRCGIEKKKSEFRARAKSSDGLAHWCRPCFREYDRNRYANGDSVRKSANRKAMVMKARGIVLEHLEQHPCMDCGESDPVVLEFDHRGDKKFNISEGYSRGIPSLIAELNKCDVRCANCHRRKTARDYGFWRHRDIA